MRRTTIAIGIAAILASSCGDTATIEPAVATTLQDRVAAIRGMAEDGRPGDARAAVRNLMVFVMERLDAGRIDQAKAMEIIEAAQLVVLRLELLPRPAATESPSSIPSPTEEDEGEGKPDKDDGKGKGHGEDGNEGHGNDD